MSIADTIIGGSLISRGKIKVYSHNSEIACLNNSNYLSINNTISDMGNLPSKVTEKYQGLRSLGKGGFGKVYLIKDKKENKKYAMKVVPIDKGNEKYAISESNILKLLNHPFVISVEDIIAASNVLYLIMEFMEGGDLSQLIRPKLCLNESQTKLIFYQLTLAVEYLHKQGICHRDLKPENILLKERSPDTLIKVTDFGLSKNEFTQSKMVSRVGTPYYMAPEVLSNGIYSNSCDVWSMGIILSYCLTGELTGKVEANGQFILQKNPKKWAHVTVKAQELVGRMICRDVSRRISITDILDHPWLQDSIMQNKVRRLMETEETMPNMDTYSSMYVVSMWP